jgi:hypothetical protein
MCHLDRGTLAAAEDFPWPPSYPRAASSRRPLPPPTLGTVIWCDGVVLLCVIGQRAHGTHALSSVHGRDPIAMTLC